MLKVIHRWIAVTASLIFASASLAVFAAEPTQRQWTVGTDKREALIYVPESAKTTDSPVVFAFHGHGGNMRNASRMFPIHKLWPEAICVYMQGLNTPGQLTDPEGKKPGWQKAAGDQNDRDLKFFDAVLESLHKECKVDDSKIFSTGHSNGGGFTYLLLAERGDKLAAIAPSASAAARRFNDYKPKPTMHLMADNDPLVKSAWQVAMIDGLKKLNQCSMTAVPWADGACKLFKSPIGAPVVTMVHDQGHKFPDKGAELIVKFFKEYKTLAQ
ncbi:MAG: hypothetical protein U0930_14360 [Pirellulales bacterium]